MTVRTQTRPLLEQARAAMPGLAALAEAVPKVVAALVEARARVRPASEVHQDAVNAVLSGGAVPSDLGARLLDVEQNNREAQAQYDALTRLRSDLLQQRRDLCVTHADRALTVLAEALDDLLAEARPLLAEIGDVDSSDAAISANMVKPWRRVQELAALHSELREAQAAIVSDALEPPTGARIRTIVSSRVRHLVETVGTVQNFTVLYPDGYSPSGAVAGQASRFKIVNGRVVELTEQPKQPSTSAPWLTGDPVAALRYLASPDAQPWVPTMAQLDQAQKAPEPVPDKPRSLMVSEKRARAISRKLPPMSEPAARDRGIEDY
jgi:hypothetical protein